MKFFYRKKGVISVFLIMIMLPIFTSAVLLVDGARYQSAKTIIQEAGDLAAYSTIADYNMELKEKYGLFAIADENVNETFNRYFKESLGLSESEAESYSQKIQNLMNGLIGGNQYKNANFFDMYNFNVVSAKAEAEFNLAEPDVLQSQIVEFMKYRGVETVLERFDILANASKVKEESKKNEEISNAISELSKVDTSCSSIATKLGQLNQAIDNYNISLSNIDTYYANFEANAVAELVEMAFFSDTLHNFRKTRDTSCDKLLSAIGSAKTAYDVLAGQIAQIIKDAETAKGKYVNLREKYKDQKEICQDIDEEIKILNKILDSNSNSTDSMVYLQSRLRYPSEELTSLYSNALALNSRIEDAHIKYKKDVEKKRKEMEAEEYYTEEEILEEIKKIKYFMDIAGNGSNWKYTDYIPVYDVETESEIKSSARHGITLTLDKQSLSGFKCPSSQNAYKERTNDQNLSSEEEDYYKNLAKEKSNEANGKGKEDTKNTKETNVEIVSSVFNKLPSKLAGVKEKGEKEVEKISSADATAAIDSANAAGSGLLNVIETGRDEVLTFCYIFDMFKTRVTAKKIGVVEGADKNKYKDTTHNKWYHTQWRYQDPRGEVDSRDRAKNTDIDTVFNSKEIEYIFTGSNKEASNGAVVYSWIYGTRLANNLVTVYMNKSARAQCEALAAACSAATLGTVPPAVFKWVFIAAWAAGETSLELAYLIDDGFRVPLVKTKELYIKDITKIGTALTDRESLISSDLKSAVNVCYEDYLIILLCFVDSKTRLLRIADLIQLNMNGGKGSGDFTMANANTYVNCSTNVKIKYMFQPVKQFKNSYKGSGLTIKNQIYQGY